MDVKKGEILLKKIAELAGATSNHRPRLQTIYRKAKSLGFVIEGESQLDTDDWAALFICTQLKTALNHLVEGTMEADIPPGIVSYQAGGTPEVNLSWRYDINRKHPQKELLPGDNESSKDIRVYHGKAVIYVMLMTMYATGVQSVKRCPACKTVFFRTSKKKKDYCTPRCQNKTNVKTWRSRKNSNQGGSNGSND